MSLVKILIYKIFLEFYCLKKFYLKYGYEICQSSRILQESAAPFKPGTVELELKSWEERGRKSFLPSISKAVLPHHLEPEGENGAE